jgi:hypothetical protein
MTPAANRELEALILQIKGLVFVQALLEDKGASQAELAAHRAELARQRMLLAELARHTAA